jgi:uncharacterized iron-regulated membrane protein
MLDTTAIKNNKRAFGRAICQRIVENIRKLGFEDSQAIKYPQYENAEFTLVTDPYSQSQDLVGYWRGSKGQKIGQIRFHGDGSFYAEYDIVLPHPQKPRFFVEAINAWGNAGNIKTEAKLLEIPQ